VSDDANIYDVASAAYQQGLADGMTHAADLLDTAVEMTAAVHYEFGADDARHFARSLREKAEKVRTGDTT
jgi:hypothetical protein